MLARHTSNSVGIARVGLRASPGEWEHEIRHALRKIGQNGRRSDRSDRADRSTIVQRWRALSFGSEPLRRSGSGIGTWRSRCVWAPSSRSARSSQTGEENAGAISGKVATVSALGVSSLLARRRHEADPTYGADLSNDARHWGDCIPIFVTARSPTRSRPRVSRTSWTTKRPQRQCGATSSYNATSRQVRSPPDWCAQPRCRTGRERRSSAGNWRGSSPCGRPRTPRGPHDFESCPWTHFGPNRTRFRAITDYLTRLS